MRKIISVGVQSFVSVSTIKVIKALIEVERSWLKYLTCPHYPRWSFGIQGVSAIEIPRNAGGFGFRGKCTQYHSVRPDRSKIKFRLTMIQQFYDT
jgi:hypothetical protein